jgi:hypothetical protein
MRDLFTSEVSKKERLLNWMLECLETKNWVKTSDVYEWGVKNSSNRAVRNAQQFCRDGRFRRMTDEEHMTYFPGSKQEVWVRNDFV